MLKKLLLSTTLFLSSASAMHEFELNLNDKDIDLHLGLDMGQFNDNVEPDNVFITTRLLIGGEDHARLPNIQSRNYLGEVGFLVQSTSSFSPGLTMGMGIKYDYGALKNTSAISAVPIGVEGDYVLPFDIALPLHVGGLFYYAPEVLSFAGSQHYMEYEAHFDIELMERGLITTGYRGLETPLQVTDKAYFNRSFFFGLKFKF